MTIKDIARLAGVSISTVSKIINGKDSGIKAETRDRVLAVVKEYRYKPYDFIKEKKESENFLIGLLIPAAAEHGSFIGGFLYEAEVRGYQVQVCVSSCAESECKHIAALCKNRVDAVLWEACGAENSAAVSLLKQAGIPFYRLNNSADKTSLTYDYAKAGYAAANELIKAGHQKIYCLYNNAEPNKRHFLHGVERCLFDHRGLYIEYKDLREAVFVRNCSGIICCGWDNVSAVYEFAEIHKLSIPHDISLICIDDEKKIKNFPCVSSVALLLHGFGKYACDYIIHKIEKKKNILAPYAESFLYKDGKSVDVPLPLRSKRIIVIGSINMDILLAVKHYPQTGESIPADNVSMIPGGKGINQAVGTAKLGAKVSLIGNVGRDFDGNVILNVLHENAVDTSAVRIDTEHPTGKAYIHVQEDGESGIVLYGGANESVCADTIFQNENLFSDAAFCLLQTEIPMSAVTAAVKTAKKNNVKIMLKPSAVKNIDTFLLQDLDYFIPNRKELYLLCPLAGTIEQKAEWFLQQGVKTVIVTLGAEGCYVCCKDYKRYVPAAPFTAVDTTGAADAFISALAVFLLEDKPLAEALTYAAYAAGFSTTRIGTVPSLIDSATLRHYMRKLN